MLSVGRVYFLKDSQVSFTRPSDKGGLKVNTLEWLEAVAWGTHNFIL